MSTGADATPLTDRDLWRLVQQDDRFAGSGVVRSREGIELMHSELSVLRPLVELAVIVVIVGLAGCIGSRDRQGWWLSQGLVVLGLLIGLAAAGELHPTSPVMSLAVWLPLALLIEGSLTCRTGK